MQKNDPRFLVLTENGACSMLGREAPDASTVAAFTENLSNMRRAGWIARASGSFHGRTKPRVTLVQAVNGPAASFASAVALAGGEASPGAA